MLRDVANYLLEPAHLADARRISLLSRDLIEAGLNPAWPEARVAAFIRHRESMVLTARATSRGEIAGFAIMQFGDERAHLNLLAVAPRHQRRGVARHLMAWLETSALTAGTFMITLELRAANVAAHAFYTAIGYREIGRVTGYYERAEDAIRMGRDVRPGQVLSCGGGACAS
jgi:ribosomal protein S18 acetylase RimI-like enzyme